jgi:hypothetical protein
MLDVLSIYQDSARDNVNKDENGDFGYELFNRISRRAELRLIDWLTGDVAGVAPPTPYLTQKNKDWVAFLIKKHNAQFVGGEIDKPSDYYQWDNFYRIGGKVVSDCEEPEEFPEDNPDIPIEILDGQQYNVRRKTFIDELKPSYTKPVSKLVGKKFEATPKDLGSVTLEYIRYPVFGKIVTKFDPVYNDDIADPAASTDYEWDEYARELLIWFITDTFTIHNREQALKQANLQTGKTVRG